MVDLDPAVMDEDMVLKLPLVGNDDVDGDDLYFVAGSR